MIKRRYSNAKPWNASKSLQDVLQDTVNATRRETSKSSESAGTMENHSTPTPNGSYNMLEPIRNHGILRAHDTALKWPFRGKVMVELLNQL